MILTIKQIRERDYFVVTCATKINYSEITRVYWRVIVTFDVVLIAHLWDSEITRDLGFSGGYPKHMLQQK